MKFFKVLPKEKQNLKNACKTCNSLQDFRPATSLKTDSKKGVFFVNIPNILARTFFMEQFQWLLLNCFSIRMSFQKRKLEERLPLN